jgi:hypothetical protein
MVAALDRLERFELSERLKGLAPWNVWNESDEGGSHARANHQISRRDLAGLE